MKIMGPLCAIASIFTYLISALFWYPFRQLALVFYFDFFLFNCFPFNLSWLAPITTPYQACHYRTASRYKETCIPVIQVYWDKYGTKENLPVDSRMTRKLKEVFL